MTVFIEAIHTVKPITATAMIRWVDYYGEVVIPALERNGHDVVGAFKRTTGEHGQDLVLMRYASLADYERAVVSILKDREFLVGREKRPAELVVQEETKAAVALPFATAQRLEAQLAERPERRRQYRQAVVRAREGRAQEAHAAVSELADLIDSTTDSRLVTAYETTIGKRLEFTDLWVSPVIHLGYRNRDAHAELMARVYDAAPEESSWILSPLPYSRLQ